MQDFKAFHLFLFATSSLLLAQTVKNIYVSIGFYMVALVLYILAWVKFNKEKRQ
ncbi:MULTISPECIES: hypothetical protein [unclassified Flavobacterium]|uniref:hypothetical protein n=1 Tax=unclassified Flavobacterium TaxID=196869 RepID=UPI0036230F0A